MEQEEKLEGTPLAFDEILADKVYQSEFDKRVTKALDTAKEKWIKEAEAAKIEAEAIAKLDADKQAEYRKNKETERADKAERELNSYKVKTEATEYAARLGLPISFLPSTYENETVDTITKRIDDMYSDFCKNLESKVKENLKEPTPKTVVGDATTQKTVSRASY